MTTRIFITGASSGLGRGLALGYAAPGVTLGLLSRRAGALREVAQEGTRRGAKVVVLPGDVRDTEQMQAAADAFLSETGGVDIAIANAGIGEPRDDQRLSAAEVAGVLGTNLLGVTNTLLPFVPAMRRGNRGTLVAVASMAGFRALPGSLSYSTAKAAVMCFMEGLGQELASTEIATVCLCPGFVRTEITARNDFHMPFLLECDDACRRMRKAIARRRSRYVFPLPMRLLSGPLRLAPQAVLHWVSPKSVTKTHP